MFGVIAPIGGPLGYPATPLFTAPHTWLQKRRLEAALDVTCPGSFRGTALGKKILEPLPGRNCSGRSAGPPGASRPCSHCFEKTCPKTAELG